MSAMERKTFYGFLILFTVPTMVGEWVFQIVDLFRQNSIKLKFGCLAIPGMAVHLSKFFFKTSAKETTFCGFLILFTVSTMIGVWIYKIVSRF